MYDRDPSDPLVYAFSLTDSDGCISTPSYFDPFKAADESVVYRGFQVSEAIGVGEQRVQGHPNHFQARRQLQARHNKPMFCTLN